MDNITLWLVVLAIFTGILGLGCMYLAWSLSSAQRSLRKMHTQIAQWGDRVGVLEDDQVATRQQLSEQQSSLRSLNATKEATDGKNSSTSAGAANASDTVSADRSGKQAAELVHKVSRLEADVQELQRRVQGIVDSSGGLPSRGFGAASPSDGVLLDLVQDIRRRRGTPGSAAPLIAAGDIAESGNSPLLKLRRRSTAGSPRNAANRSAYGSALPTAALDGYDIALPTNLPQPFTPDGWIGTPSQADIHNALHRHAHGYRSCRIETVPDGKGGSQIRLTYVGGLFKNRVVLIPFAECAAAVVALDTLPMDGNAGGGQECVCLIFRMRTARNAWASKMEADSPMSSSRTSWANPTNAPRGATSGAPLAIEEHRTLRMLALAPIGPAVDEWITYLDEMLGIVDAAALSPSL